MEIRPYTREMEPHVKAFNERLRFGGEHRWKLPETHVLRFTKPQDTLPYQEFFLTCDQDEIRGGYQLTHTLFTLRGSPTWIACGPQYNISEGIVNRSYGMVGVVHVQDALQRQPLMYALGMGGLNEPQAKLLSAMKWNILPVPFFFRVVNVSRFLANIVYLRRSKRNRVILDSARYTGVGWLGVHVAQARLPKRDTSIQAEPVSEFGSWADSIWDRSKGTYSFAAFRNCANLNALYPSSSSRFIRLKISRSPGNVGWAVVLDTQMSKHKQFGDMRVGTIVDCLAHPECAGDVIRGCTTFLEERGVDIIVSNQASSQWGQAFAPAGYLKGPTNFFLATSTMLTKHLEPLRMSQPGIHMNRGDGDGPIHL